MKTEEQDPRAEGDRHVEELARVFRETLVPPSDEYIEARRIVLRVRADEQRRTVRIIDEEIGRLEVVCDSRSRILRQEPLRRVRERLESGDYR